jgi:hypothetical protein
MIFLSSLLLIYFITQISSKLYIIKPEQYFIIRNNILRKIINDDIVRTKLLVKSTKIIYNKILTKYYDFNQKYYSLSEDERAIIEAVISLTY